MLHFIFQSPLQKATLERVSNTDSVVFFENALFNLLKNSEFRVLLEESLATQNLYVIEDEINTRGILAEELISLCKVIDYQSLVTLTTEHKTILTWN